MKTLVILYGLVISAQAVFAVVWIWQGMRRRIDRRRRWLEHVAASASAVSERNQARSIRPVEYTGQTVPAGTLATVLDTADEEGFLMVEWKDRAGHYSVHCFDVEETGAAEAVH